MFKSKEGRKPEEAGLRHQVAGKPVKKKE